MPVPYFFEQRLDILMKALITLVIFLPLCSLFVAHSMFSLNARRGSVLKLKSSRATPALLSGRAGAVRVVFRRPRQRERSVPT